ncbi:glycoside hydrolase family 3 N-terminal domain-containing protein [Natrinema amylolyticum]|uniref:glycoside hydrolase family 3 N-terminal domain-containing protein n=1 Tax=Natrinema amylolyticum TaxID=2878679 RepID=UPI001CFA2304|nr:glycoside hydrolase family 3 N-terminal domain-containing protein [Natrinema amylolyticum]
MRKDDRSRSDAGLTRRTALKTGALTSTSLFLGTIGAGSAAADEDDPASIVEEMTLEEKVSRTHGADGGPEGIAGYLQGVERLDVSGMGMADSPTGVVAADPATDFPHPIAAAATFNPTLIESEGRAIAREAKALDVSVLLGPSMDTFRVPLHSRAGETYGEDPYLASRMAAAFTGAVQSEGVIATLKHFVAYNQTRATGDVYDYYSTSEHDVRVGERALRELYLPPFEAGVREGDAGAVMPAYNRINGTFSSEHPELLTDVLRDEWGFDGFVVSDWGGTHSTVDAAEAGLDVEMPSEEYFGETLAEAVEAGDIDESVVDEMVRRTLTSQAEIGALEGDRIGSEPAHGTDEHFELAERMTEEGTVLLKNEDDVLPLDESEIEEVALVGPSPEEFKNSVGGSDAVPAIRRRGPVDGIKAVVGKAVDVTAVETDRRELVEADDGFAYEYYDGENFDGEPTETGSVSAVDFDDDAAAAVWEGTVTAPESGSFGLALTSQGESTLYVDGDVVAENLGGGFAGPNTVKTAVNLEEGVEYDLRVEAVGGSPVRFEWNPPAALDDAVAAAGDADAAVVLAQSNTTYGDDRIQFGLPSNQNALVERVADANDETVVLLNTESPVAMPWIDSVSSIFQLWFPGQEAGTAVANLLFGRTTPSGKSPVTFARDLEDYLPGEIDVVPNDARAYPGVDGTVHYDEGVFVGYRHFDERDIEPVFPFGHGESYAEFAYSDLELEANDDGLDVSLTVANDGDYDGKEAVQLYVSDVDASVDRPKRELAAIEKVSVTAGESERVTLRVDHDDLAFYDADGGEWVVEPGAFDVAVGRSSRDLRLEGTFEVDDELSIVLEEESDEPDGTGDDDGEEDEDGSDETNDTDETGDDTGADDGTPGFGVPAGITGLVGGLLAAKRAGSTGDEAAEE